MATEKRLVYAREVEEIFNFVENECSDSYEAFKVAVNKATTVDAVEVVHGRCVYVRDDELTDHWECSVCGKYIPWEYHRDWNYCPNCGAKMDGVQE